MSLETRHIEDEIYLKVLPERIFVVFFFQIDKSRTINQFIDTTELFRTSNFIGHGLTQLYISFSGLRSILE